MHEVMAEIREAATDIVNAHLRDPFVTALFKSCFTYSLPKTFQMLNDETAFVVTGDIPAMWLRDSSCQVRHILPFVRDIPEANDVVTAVLRRQMRYIELDPYANAFNSAPNNAGHHLDSPQSSPWVWERKYEGDSLAHPFHLGYLMYKMTGQASWFDDHARAACHAMMTTICTEQHHEAQSLYRFTRPDAPVASDTLCRQGRGPLTVPTGLTWSAFRPSDDATRFGYNIPGNAFIAVVLGEVSEMLESITDDQAIVNSARNTRSEILMALDQRGRFLHPEAGLAWWYEVDGRGGSLFMDDANIPSLLSLPLLDCCTADDPVYLATRSLVLSPENPYFYSGKYGEGIGSPHTPPGHVWPLSLCVQGLTAPSADEQEMVLSQLLRSAATTGVMHESFSCEDPEVFTRPWFSWANAMFCELLLSLSGRPVPHPWLDESGHE